MQLRNSPERYGAVAQALHWAVVILVLLAWATGTFGDELPRGAARTAGLFVHISAGLAVLAFAAMRLFWRAVDPPPPSEKTVLGRWAERCATLAHYALYALLIAIPIVGITIQFARGNPLPVFGLFEVGSPWSADRAFAHSLKEVHELLANGLLALAGLHAAAALIHHWVLRDRTLLRMLPRASAKAGDLIYERR
ncbi:MAG TPA: cytochrome b [Alphaproteobacteria bacterium]|nr:cytochrome b [Alphaproteobacteria bacterium]